MTLPTRPHEATSCRIVPFGRMLDKIADRKKEYGIAHRDDVQAFFDLLDVDEGREPRTHF